MRQVGPIHTTAGCAFLFCFWEQRHSIVSSRRFVDYSLYFSSKASIDVGRVVVLSCWLVGKEHLSKIVGNCGNCRTIEKITQITPNYKRNDINKLLPCPLSCRKVSDDAVWCWWTNARPRWWITCGWLLVCILLLFIPSNSQPAVNLLDVVWSHRK